jgi:hypothetical protein
MKSGWSTTFRSRGRAAVGWVLAVLAAGLGTGCDSGPKLYRVSGKVTFNGKPVPAGVILFYADTTKGNDAPGGYAVIKDGQYDTRNKGKGVVGGPYRVTLTGADGVPVKVGGEMKFQGTPLFREYTVSIDLPPEPTVHDFNVPASQGLRSR